MRWFLYNVLFAIGYTLMLPKFFMRMKKRGGYRADFSQRLGHFSPEVARKLAEKPRIWIHAVSVGEANLAGGVLNELRRLAPNESFILSTTSSTGHAVCEKLLTPDDVLIYLPIDFPHVIRRAFQTIQAKALILTESEFWPNLIRTCQQRKIPVFLVNGRVSDRSAPRYQALRYFFSEVFHCFTALYVQSDLDRDRLVAAGAPQSRIEVMGSVKFDVKPPSAAQCEVATQTLQQGGIEVASDFILLGGSTWPGEELALVKAWQTARQQVPHLKLVLVPRHMERGNEIEQALNQQGLTCLRRSRLKTQTESNVPSENSVLLVDTTGELFALYAFANLVFVGKTLDPNIGGQNMIEPASFGKGIVVGPHTENFTAIMHHFRVAQALCEVTSAEALETAICTLTVQPEQAEALGKKAQGVVESQRGALQRTAKALLAHLA